MEPSSIDDDDNDDAVNAIWMVLSASIGAAKEVSPFVLKTTFWSAAAAVGGGGVPAVVDTSFAGRGGDGGGLLVLSIL